MHRCPTDTAVCWGSAAIKPPAMASLLTDLQSAVLAVLEQHGAMDRRDVVIRAITDQIASVSEAEEQRFLELVCRMFNADLVVA